MIDQDQTWTFVAILGMRGWIVAVDTSLVRSCSFADAEGYDCSSWTYVRVGFVAVVPAVAFLVQEEGEALEWFRESHRHIAFCQL